MKKVLKMVWKLQQEAFEKGIYTFEVTARYFGDGDSGIMVTIFLKGDGTDGDYGNFPIYGGADLKGEPTEQQLWKVEGIARFIGVKI